MKFKKLGKKLVIPAAVCMMLVGGVAPSFANNCKDKDFKFEFKALDSVQYTADEDKEDYSSSYIKCTYMTRKDEFFKARVVGIGRDFIYRDCSKNGKYVYTIHRGTETKMANMVKERDMDKAAIKAYNFISLTGRYDAAGLWSPDSV